jgi:hypothetical protein
MTNMMMMGRTDAGMMPGMGMPGMGMPGMGTGATPAGPSMMMVPRCSMKMEKVQGGMKITCTCDDQVAAGMVQNLCTMLQGGMCTCCMMMNGMTVCCCNLMMGMCRCEAAGSGCTVTCTSGDPKCAEMIQACCDCLGTMMKDGCTCCLMMNNTPVCCGMM